jgi:hypothetical protein
MPTIGPSSPTAAANNADSGSVAWSNPSNALASDDSRTTATLSSSSESNGLDLTAFAGFSALSAFAIPTGLTINIERRKSPFDGVADAQVQLLSAGSAVGPNKANLGVEWPITDGTASYNWTAAELAAAGIGAAQLAASGFGVRVRAIETSGEFGPDAEVDHVQATLDYDLFIPIVNPGRSYKMLFTRADMDPLERLPWNWDFSEEDVFAASPITAATITDWEGAAVSGITVGTPAISSPFVQTLIHSPAQRTVYRLKCLAENALGHKRAAFLQLTVRIPTPDPVT